MKSRGFVPSDHERCEFNYLGMDEGKEMLENFGIIEKKKKKGARGRGRGGDASDNEINEGDSYDIGS